MKDQMLSLGSLRTSRRRLISGGTLALGAATALPSAGNVTLSGGTLAFGGFTPVATLGTLSLTSTSTIDFGSGVVTVAFADSSAAPWTGTLTLTNFTVGEDTLRFGTTIGGISSGQWAAISLTGYTATWPGLHGYVQFTSVPEPSTYALGIVGFLAVVLGTRRLRAKTV
jgi:hypothetical protein